MKDRYALSHVILGLLLMSAINAQGATYAGLSSAQHIESELVFFPELDTVKEVDVGESMIYVLRQNTSKGIKLKKPLSGVVSALWSKFNINIDTSPMELRSEKNGALFYVSSNEASPDIKNSKAAIRFPRDDSEPFEICYFDRDFYNCDKTIKLVQGTDYEAVPIVSTSDVSFKRELSYIGGNKNSITLMYREYKDNFARPAFTQELKYDISDDNIIGFKGARFKIIKANNTGITYSVLKHLGE